MDIIYTQPILNGQSFDIQIVFNFSNNLTLSDKAGFYAEMLIKNIFFDKY